MTETTKKYNVPALDKAFAIIETLAGHDQPLGITELCKLLGLPKTTVFFIVNKLDQMDYIVKTQEGKYQLSTKFMSIGINMLNKFDIRSVAKPFMQRLFEESGLTVHLAIVEKGEAVYIDKVDKQGFIMVSTYIGQRNPIHASAIGKAIAAYLPDSKLDEIIEERGLPRFTEKTITSTADFKAALETIRRSGYAIDDEDAEYGIRCVGAPIFNHENKVVASVGVTSLRADLPDSALDGLGAKVKATAMQISQQLGYADKRSTGR